MALKVLNSGEMLYISVMVSVMPVKLNHVAGFGVLISLSENENKQVIKTNEDSNKKSNFQTNLVVRRMLLSARECTSHVCK